MTDHASMIILPLSWIGSGLSRRTFAIEATAWNNRRYEEVAAGRLDTALSAEAAPPFLETEVLFSTILSVW